MTREPPPRSSLSATGVQRLVCALVSDVDSRALEAVRYARRVQARHHCAVHIAEDSARAEALGLAWMQEGIDMPLVVVDDVGGISSSLVYWLGANRGEPFDDVVVVVPRFVLRSRWRGLMHERTSDRIAFELRVLQDVYVELVGVEAG